MTEVLTDDEADLENTRRHSSVSVSRSISGFLLPILLNPHPLSPFFMFFLGFLTSVIDYVNNFLFPLLSHPFFSVFFFALSLLSFPFLSSPILSRPEGSVTTPAVPGVPAVT